MHPDSVDFSSAPIEDWRMMRVTFASPFLATTSLWQAGLDYTDKYFTAKLIPETFYVDDFIYGADTKEAVLAISLTCSKRCLK